MFTVGYVNRWPATMISGAPAPSRCTESIAPPTAANAAASPQAARASCRPKTTRWSRRGRSVSGRAGKAVELTAAPWIELGHLPGEVGQRHVAVLLDEGIDPRLRSQVGVCLAGVGGSVEVGPALAPAGQQPLAVKPGKDRHVGGVGTGMVSASVEQVHHCRARRPRPPSRPP